MHRAYDIADIPNYTNKHKFGFLVSEPHKYFGTFVVINIGMVLFYVFSVEWSRWYLAMFSLIFHFLSIFFMVILAFVDPGIIPKIFGGFESTDYSKIPIS